MTLRLNAIVFGEPHRSKKCGPVELSAGHRSHRQNLTGPFAVAHGVVEVWPLR